MISNESKNIVKDFLNKESMENHGCLYDFNKLKIEDEWHEYPMQLLKKNNGFALYNHDTNTFITNQKIKGSENE